MANPVDEVLAFAGSVPKPDGRPIVTLTYAQSLDGSLTHQRGQTMALSGFDSLVMTHHLRAFNQAILVGIGTVLADDPLLTTRHGGGRSPQPVVLDTALRCPPDSRLMQASPLPWIFCGPAPPQPEKNELVRRGARALPLPPSPHGGLDLAALLQTLDDLGVHSLMVEGGARVITSFLSAGLVDLMIVTIAPLLVGGLRAPEQVLEPSVSLRDVRALQMGQDLVFAARVKHL